MTKIRLLPLAIHPNFVVSFTILRRKRFRIRRKHGWLHVVAHGTSTAKSARTALTHIALRCTRHRCAICNRRTTDGKRLSFRTKSRPTNPEFHHGQERGYSSTQDKRQCQTRCRNKPLRGAGKEIQLYNTPHRCNDNYHSQNEIVIAKIIRPRWCCSYG